MHLHYSFKKCDTSHFIRSKNVIFFLYIPVKQGGEHHAHPLDSYMS